MTISLAFLAPDLVKAAIEGRLPRGIGVARLRDAPAEWSRQYRILGLPSPKAGVHLDHGVTVVSQSYCSRISCMQTGLCRMQTESLAPAFTAHRETDFGR